MPVPHLTRPGALPPSPPLKKIGFEEHFLVPEAIPLAFARLSKLSYIVAFTPEDGEHGD